MVGATQIFDNAARKILVGEQTRLCREQVSPEFMRKVAGIRKAHEQIFPR